MVKKLIIDHNEKGEIVSPSYVDIVSKNRMDILYILGFIFITTIASFSFLEVHALPIIYDDDYIVEKFATGLEFPTTMTFVGDEILVLEKNTGKVILIQDNGVSYNEPALVVPVNFQQEAGLLGIASTSNHIYLYFIESLSGFDDLVSGWSYQVDDRIKIKDSKIVVYQYDWNGKKLINPILIEELPVFHGSHLGGVITTGLNNEVYFVIGDQWRYITSSGDVITYNIDNTFQNIPVDTIYETGSIFKIDTESNNSVELFAMGIRNSFGLAVDPVTGYLWDTENSQQNYDEINLVKSGFNSGWINIMGPADRVDTNLDTIDSNPFGNFVYGDPKFSWYKGVAPTAIAFPDKDGFRKYSESLFVGDFNNGRIYNFQLNSDRTGFIFSNPDLSDLVLDDSDKMDEIIFAEDITGGVSDIKFYDGAMYVVSIYDGNIYKIYSKELAEEKKLSKTEMLKLLETRTNAEYINLGNTDFTGISFDNVSISNVNFTRANLSHANLSGHDITGTILTGANLSNANLTGLDLSSMDLTDTILIGANLSNANLTNSILTGANLSNANLINTDLRDTVLVDANITNSILTGANLSNANLTNTDLRDTVLVDANLTNAILTGANLSDATLTGAILTGIDLENAVITNTILKCIDGTVKDRTVIQSLECYFVNLTQICKFWIFNFCN